MTTTPAKPPSSTTPPGPPNPPNPNTPPAADPQPAHPETAQVAGVAPYGDGPVVHEQLERSNQMAKIGIDKWMVANDASIRDRPAGQQAQVPGVVQTGVPEHEASKR